MKQNLIERLGPEYCTQRLSGALFNYEGVVHEFGTVGTKKVECTAYHGTPEKHEAKVALVPTSFFTDWGALRFPTLGYRQAAGGQMLFLLGRKGSVQRGLQLRQLQVHMHPVTIACAIHLGVDYHFHRTGGALILNTMQPQYTPFMEGLEAVMKGERPAFAVSADFAVAPAEDVDFLEILFRGRRIGEVSEGGNVTITATGILPSWNKAINK
jgi:hypothetical protein